MKDLLKSIALFLLAAICNKIIKDNLPNLGYKNLKKYWDSYLQWVSILLLLFFLFLHTSKTYQLPKTGLLVIAALAAFQSLYAMTEIKNQRKYINITITNPKAQKARIYKIRASDTI